MLVSEGRIASREVYAVLKRRERILRELRERLAAAPTAVSEGWLLGALGETDAAFEVLARAEEECEAFLYYTGLPAFDPLRADVRFGALLERLGQPSAA